MNKLEVFREFNAISQVDILKEKEEDGTLLIQSFGSTSLLSAGGWLVGGGSDWKSSLSLSLSVMSCAVSPPLDYGKYNLGNSARMMRGEQGKFFFYAKVHCSIIWLLFNNLMIKITNASVSGAI